MENKKIAFQITKAGIDDIPLIQQLSHVIWNKHYPEIISRDQIDYMLNKMYGTERLSKEISNPAYSYYLIHLQEQSIGYLAISENGVSSYMLHKFYLLQTQQAKGLGEQIFKAIFEPLKPKEIRLFVNRQNFKSVNFYFKMGFKICETVDNHFGAGYYMNDFVMQWSSDSKA